MKKAFWILFLVAAFAVANPDEKKPTKDRETRELVRDSDSVEYFDATVLVTEENGKPKVHYSVTVPRGVQHLAGRYRYSEDLDRGTYKIIEVEKFDEMEGVSVEPAIDPEEHQHVLGRDGASADDTDAGDAVAPKAGRSGDIPVLPDPCPCGGAECQGNINLTVRSWAWEPGTLKEVLLMKTSVKGGWIRKVDFITKTCKWQNYGPSPVTCSILNPSPYTWYPNGLNPCAKAGPTTNGEGVWWTYGQGSYKSQNWALPGFWTYVTDSAMPGISHGVLQLDWDHYPSGDSAPFLFGEFEVTYSNTCMQ